MRIPLLAFLAMLFLNCNGAEPMPQSVQPNDAIELDFIQLPEGFKIYEYASDVPNARSMALSQKGTLFVGTRRGGNVFALQDSDNNFVIDKVHTVASGLNMPNGVALREGDLYVAEVSKVWRFDDVENHLETPPSPVLINGTFPTNGHHGWKFIRFGPDGKLYVPVGAPCNVCDEDDERFASILRMNPDGTDLEVFAQGVRNTVGFDWHPSTKELWFTDNGRDMLGDDIPPCELNHAPVKGLHFGFPYCHGNDISDPEHGQNKNCSEFVPPAQELGPHVAPLGMRFYTGKMFPKKYQNQIFFAEHGSWNRSKKIGYRVMLATLNEQGNVTSYEPFATGWLDDDTQAVSGRPVDIEILPDGSLLVSDDQAGKIYRITYEGS